MLHIHVFFSTLLGRSLKTCYLRLGWLFNVYTRTRIKNQNSTILNILLLQTDITSHTSCRYIHNTPTKRHPSTFLTPDIINKITFYYCTFWFSSIMYPENHIKKNNNCKGMSATREYMIITSHHKNCMLHTWRHIISRPATVFGLLRRKMAHIKCMLVCSTLTKRKSDQRIPIKFENQNWRQPVHWQPLCSMQTNGHDSSFAIVY